uniref:SAGA-associated factor 11 n=1 Tax=Heterorhabditis bacteriophora TaxID=37862 RepID=A0A1I7XR97_HETBA
MVYNLFLPCTVIELSADRGRVEQDLKVESAIDLRRDIIIEGVSVESESMVATDDRLRPPPHLPIHLLALSESLETYIMDVLILDCCFDVHREASILHRHKLEIDSPPSSPQVKEVNVKCRVCGRHVGAKVFEKHILNCLKMDGSRSSSRVAAKKIAEQELISESNFHDDDFVVAPLVATSSGDDEDWNAPKKRRKAKRRNNSCYIILASSKLVYVVLITASHVYVDITGDRFVYL